MGSRACESETFVHQRTVNGNKFLQNFFIPEHTRETFNVFTTLEIPRVDNVILFFFFLLLLRSIFFGMHFSEFCRPRLNCCCTTECTCSRPAMPITWALVALGCRRYFRNSPPFALTDFSTIATLRSAGIPEYSRRRVPRGQVTCFYFFIFHENANVLLPRFFFDDPFDLQSAFSNEYVLWVGPNFVATGDDNISGKSTIRKFRIE